MNRSTNSIFNLQNQQNYQNPNKPNYYFGNYQESFIKQILNQLLPKCDHCGTIKLYICVQQICKIKQPICYQCTKNSHSLHFLHDCNQIRLLLFNNSLKPFITLVRPYKKKLKQFIQNEINIIKLQLKEYTEYISFLQQYNKKIFINQCQQHNMETLTELDQLFCNIDPFVIRTPNAYQNKKQIEIWSKKLTDLIQKIDLNESCDIIKFNQEIKINMKKTAPVIQSISSISNKINNFFQQLIPNSTNLEQILLKSHMNKQIKADTTQRRLFSDYSQRTVLGGFKQLLNYSPSKIILNQDNLNNKNEKDEYRFHELLEELKIMNFRESLNLNNIIPKRLKSLIITQPIAFERFLNFKFPQNLVKLHIVLSEDKQIKSNPLQNQNNQSNNILFTTNTPSQSLFNPFPQNLNNQSNNIFLNIQQRNNFNFPNNNSGSNLPVFINSKLQSSSNIASNSTALLPSSNISSNSTIIFPSVIKPDLNSQLNKLKNLKYLYIEYPSITIQFKRTVYEFAIDNLLRVVIIQPNYPEYLKQINLIRQRYLALIQAIQKKNLRRFNHGLRTGLINFLMEVEQLQQRQNDEQKQ